MTSKVFQHVFHQRNKFLRFIDKRQPICAAMFSPCSMSTAISTEETKLLRKQYDGTLFDFKRFLQCRIENHIVQSPFPDVDIPEISLGKYMLDSFAKHGNRSAIVCAHTNHSYKYREVIEYSRIFGSALIRQGFKPGDVLMIHSLNLPEYLIAVVGALAVGGTIAPANPNSPVDELHRELLQVKPKFLLSGTECINVGLEAAKGVDSIKNVFSFGKKDSAVPFKELLLDDGSLFKVHTDVNVKEDVAFIMYSSGTTGLPKPVLLTHYNVVANLFQHSTEGQHKVGKESITLGILPFFHSFGLFIILLNYSINGGKIVSIGKFEPEVFLKKITKLNVNRLNVVPYLLNFLATDPLVEKYNLSKIRYLVVGAAPVPTAILGSLKERFPNAILSQGFGMTELSPVSHNHPVRGIDLTSVGYPVACTETKVIDIYTGEDLGVNQPGEMLIRGPQVMKGYLDNQVDTKKTITADGWLHTGDMAYYDKEGKFYINGRIKEMIKFRGLQVSPKEVENILIDHPAIIDAGVLGIPDEDSGELPAGLIVLHQDYLHFTIDEIHTYVQSKLSKHKQLSGGIKIVDRIPRNSIGKMIPAEAMKILVN